MKQILILIAALRVCLAASGLDGGIKIQSGPQANTNHVSGVTITLETNINTGSIVISNLTAGAMVKVDTNKKSGPATAGTDYVAPPAQLSLTHAGTVTLDFAEFRSRAGLSLTGSVTFATANLAAGYDYTLFVTNSQSTNCALTFPLNGGTNAWIFVGGAPTFITANKRSVLSLSARSTADTGVWAAYSEEQ